METDLVKRGTIYWIKSNDQLTWIFIKAEKVLKTVWFFLAIICWFFSFSKRVNEGVITCLLPNASWKKKHVSRSLMKQLAYCLFVNLLWINVRDLLLTQTISLKIKVVKKQLTRLMTGLMYNVSSFWPFKFLKRSLSSSLSNKMPNVYFAVLSEEEHNIQSFFTTWMSTKWN